MAKEGGNQVVVNRRHSFSPVRWREHGTKIHCSDKVSFKIPQRFGLRYFRDERRKCGFDGRSGNPKAKQIYGSNGRRNDACRGRQLWSNSSLRREEGLRISSAKILQGVGYTKICSSSEGDEKPHIIRIDDNMGPPEAIGSDYRVGDHSFNNKSFGFMNFKSISAAKTGNFILGKTLHIESKKFEMQLLGSELHISEFKGGCCSSIALDLMGCFWLRDSIQLVISDSWADIRIKSYGIFSISYDVNAFGGYIHIHAAGQESLFIPEGWKGYGFAFFHARLVESIAFMKKVDKAIAPELRQSDLTITENSKEEFGVIHYDVEKNFDMEALTLLHRSSHVREVSSISSDLFRSDLENCWKPSHMFMNTHTESISSTLFNADLEFCWEPLLKDNDIQGDGAIKITTSDCGNKDYLILEEDRSQPKRISIEQVVDVGREVQSSTDEEGFAVVMSRKNKKMSQQPEYYSHPMNSRNKASTSHEDSFYHAYPEDHYLESPYKLVKGLARFRYNHPEAKIYPPYLQRAIKFHIMHNKNLSTLAGVPTSFHI